MHHAKLKIVTIRLWFGHILPPSHLYPKMPFRQQSQPNKRNNPNWNVKNHFINHDSVFSGTRDTSYARTWIKLLYSDDALKSAMALLDCFIASFFFLLPYSSTVYSYRVRARAYCCTFSQCSPLIHSSIHHSHPCHTVPDEPSLDWIKSKWVSWTVKVGSGCSIHCTHIYIQFHCNVDCIVWWANLACHLSSWSSTSMSMSAMHACSFRYANMELPSPFSIVSHIVAVCRWSANRRPKTSFRVPARYRT